jgi:hypothetical protein
VGAAELNSRVRTVDRHVMVDLLPQLDREPDRKAEVLRGFAPIDLYLITIGTLDDLVVRRDQRREAIRAIATRADWNKRTLRQTALRARLARYVRRDRLTAKGWAQAAAGSDRLTRLSQVR